MVKYGRSKGWDFTCCDSTYGYTNDWKWILKSADGNTVIAVLESSPFRLFGFEPIESSKVCDWKKTLKPEYK